MGEKNIRFAEIDIPRALESYAPNLAILSSFLPPDQAMVNWANREITIARSKGTPFFPYLAPKLYEAPWMPVDGDHTAARTRWAGYPKQAKRTILPQELSIRAFSLYLLRFLLAADLCQAWSSFGGLAPAARSLFNGAPHRDYGIRGRRFSLPQDCGNEATGVGS